MSRRRSTTSVELRVGSRGFWILFDRGVDGVRNSTMGEGSMSDVALFRLWWGGVFIVGGSGKTEL